MALCSILLLALFTVCISQPTNAINQTDLQAAMADMRAQSYNEFANLLKIFNSIPNSLQSSNLTFLMPNDEDLSQFSITPDHLHDFILSHSIPTPLELDHLLHFPNGTLVPSSIPSKMISIINSIRAGLFVNNARVTNADVCQRTSIGCHGISAALTFDNMVPVVQAPDTRDSPKNKNVAKPFPSVKQMGTFPKQ